MHWIPKILFEVNLNVFKVLPFPTSAKATILNVAIFFKSEQVVGEEDDDSFCQIIWIITLIMILASELVEGEEDADLLIKLSELWNWTMIMIPTSELVVYCRGWWSFCQIIWTDPHQSRCTSCSLQQWQAWQGRIQKIRENRVSNRFFLRMMICGDSLKLGFVDGDSVFSNGDGDQNCRYVMTRALRRQVPWSSSTWWRSKTLKPLPSEFYHMRRWLHLLWSTGWKSAFWNFLCWAV